MIELTERQRREYLQRHLANALFDKLSRGGWRLITSRETSVFKVIGAGQAPRNASGGSTVLYASLATISASLPRFGFPMHAIIMDSKVYLEFLDQFAPHSQQNWDRLLESGIRQLFYLENNTLRRNASVHQLMCAIGTGLIERLDEMTLIVPIDSLKQVEMMSNSHKQQLVLAALRDQDS